MLNLAQDNQRKKMKQRNCFKLVCLMEGDSKLNKGGTKAWFTSNEWGMSPILSMEDGLHLQYEFVIHHRTF